MDYLDQNLVQDGVFWNSQKNTSNGQTQLTEQNLVQGRLSLFHEMVIQIWKM